MTKKQLTEKWTAERAATAAAASQLKSALVVAESKLKRAPKHLKNVAAGERNTIKGQLAQLAARAVTIDAFLKDI